MGDEYSKEEELKKYLDISFSEELNLDEYENQRNLVYSLFKDDNNVLESLNNFDSACSDFYDAKRRAETEENFLISYFEIGDKDDNE